MPLNAYFKNATTYTAVESVKARRIGAVLQNTSGTFVHFDDAQSLGEIAFPVPSEMMAVYPPGVGDWVVEDESGRQRIVPAGEFEDTYLDLGGEETRAKELAMEAHPEDFVYVGELPDRVTKADIEGEIADICYVRPTGTLTVCVLTLNNGFTVTGESACVDPANFDEVLGQSLAYQNAFEKCWSLFGFVLAELRHYRSQVEATHEVSDAPADQLSYGS